MNHKLLKQPAAFPPKDGPWAYFKSLEIEGARCFGPRQTLDLTNPEDPAQPARWTVILGENGTGKTTLLQALVGMMPALRKADDGAHIKEPGWLARPWVHFDTGVIAERSAHACFVASFKLNTGFRSVDSQITMSAEIFGSVSVGPAMATDFVQVSQDAFLPRVFAYGAHRKINEIRTSGEYEATEGYETLFSETVGLTDPAELIAQTYLVSKLGNGDEQAQRERAEAKLARLKDALVRVLPDVNDITIEVRESRPVVLFHTDYGSVRSSQLSSGYRAMAAWVGDLVGRMFDAYPDHEDPLAAPAIVLVDEFDLHMHPKWQRDAIAFLTERFPAVQFIVTAHSPLVVQSAPNANIVLLEKKGDHVVIENEPVNVATWRVDQILTSELFGLSSARRQDVQDVLDERASLLAKAELTDEERQRIAQLGEVAAVVPHADTAAEIQAGTRMDRLIDELEELVKASKG
jgi:predicted ATP-binding protein involved in virulence